MAIERIGMDFTELNNITFPEFNSSKSATDWLQEIPSVANESTNYLLGWGVMIAFFTITYSIVSERIGQHGMGYDEGQSFAISSSISFIFGLLLTMVGYIQNFKPVGVMGGLFLVIGLFIIYINNDR